jgi:hypothetical protein
MNYKPNYYKLDRKRLKTGWELFNLDWNYIYENYNFSFVTGEIDKKYESDHDRKIIILSILIPKISKDILSILEKYASSI